jgi:hypothetical protein
MPFGSEGFIDMLKFQLKQSLKPKKPGRPLTKTGAVTALFEGRE